MGVRGNSILIRGLGRGYHAKRFGKYAETKHGHLQKDCRTNNCSDEGKWSFLQKNPCGMSFRVKRLKTQYFKTKEVNKKSGSRRTSFPYYERMDRLLGRRPIVEPVAQYDSMDCAGDRSDRKLDVESVDGSEVDFTGL